MLATGSLALIAAVFHHFVAQAPKQATLSKTFYVFATLIAIFLLIRLRSTRPHPPASGQLCSDLFKFINIYICCALFLKSIYNAYFRHRGIPGKFMFIVTDWTLWNHVRTENPEETIAALHRELGEVVRVQPNHISFNNTRAFQDIYGQSTKAKKNNFYSIGGKPTSLLSEIDNSRHSFLRRIMNPCFAPANMKSFEPFMMQYLDRFILRIQQMANRNDGIVEMSGLSYNLLLDISGALTFGLDVGALENEKEHFFMARLHKSFHRLNLFSSVLWFAPILKDIPFRSRLIGKRGVLKGALNGEYTGNHTIVGTLSRAKDRETGAPFTFDDLAINSQGFLIAGSNMAGIGLTFALYSIVKYSKVWERLTHEIRSTFQATDNITGHATESLVFLNAVIYESLRLYPPITFLQPRVTPAEGMMIAGRFVAGNTIVSCPAYTMMHDERYFSNPYSFIPERWIEAERGSETCMKGAWVPFMYGKWNCIGKPLALLEMRIALAKLIWHYDITLNNGQKTPKFSSLWMTVTNLEIRVRKVDRGD